MLTPRGARVWLNTAPRDRPRLLGGSEQSQEPRTRGLERDASHVTRQGGEAVLFGMPADFVGVLPNVNARVIPALEPEFPGLCGLWRLR